MIKKIYSRISVTILMMFCIMISNPAFGKHIVGGDVTYRCKGINGTTVTFEITFTMYRDSKGGGANFDNNAVFGIFKGNGDNWAFQRVIRENPQNVGAINIDTGNPCLEVPTGIGVEKGVYKFDVVLQISDTDSYMIAYQRCCRNNTIFNILDPDITGAVYSVTISPRAQATCDNSPTFDEFPPVVICANSLLEFDHSATDIDGNQIEYSFCAPTAAGGIAGVNFGDPEACDGITPNPSNCGPPFDEVRFRLPDYRFDRPLGGDPVVGLNSFTGLISGVPNTIGQFVVGICATTYNTNGEVIGRINRDFQFNVTTCEVAVQAQIAADKIINGEEFIINSCGENTVEFVNISTDQSKIFSYDWELDVNGDLVEFDTRDITYTFPDTGSYKGFLFLNKQGDFIDCQDSAEITINIFPEITSDFDFTYDTCTAGPVDFVDLSSSGAGPILDWSWTFENDGYSSEQNPSYRYKTPGVKSVQLAVGDRNECRDSIVKEITWFPVPPLVIVEPNQFVGCVPATISFNNLSSPIDETYDIIWDFGDGNIVNEISPSHVYEEVGNYSVNVDITSPIGCTISNNFSNWITILDSPTAGFSYSPENPSIFNKTVDFTDESIGATAVLWNFNGIGSVNPNPSFTFPDTGFVEVIQIVTHPTGCTDTAFVILDIEPLVTLHMPNAFTPNNDGLNDTFKGKGFFDGFNKYQMNVWNRWGEKIYETNDPNQGWNGQKNNNGTNSPLGVYVYTITYEGPRGEQKELKGHVTLIR
ncbi:MAG: PKD domain-containing protein [Saprospiraceae bacterium]|nr:PKD domain-containing protein [Saprospiraceae bacterium]